MTKFAICTSAITHLVCPQKFALALSSFPGKTAIPRRNHKQKLWKTLGGKRGVLWQTSKSPIQKLEYKMA